MIKEENSELKAQLAEVRSQSEQSAESELGEIEIEILKILANHANADSNHLMQGIAEPEVKIKHYINRLVDSGFLAFAGGNMLDGATFYALTDKGSRYAIDNDLFI